MDLIFIQIQYYNKYTEANFKDKSMTTESGRLIIPNSDPVYESPGVPAGGANLVVYLTGTTTLADIFADAALETPIENPQTSMQSGLFYAQSTAIWADVSVAYDIVLTTLTGQSWSYTNVSLLGTAANNSGYLQNPNVQLTGAPTSTTPSANDSSAKIATTSFVASAIAAIPSPPTASATTPYTSNVKGVTTGTGGTTAAWSLDKAIMTNVSPAISVGPVTASINLSTIGLNGIDSGSVTSGTFYWVYCISDGTTPGFLASTSATTPTMPTGYTYFALVGVMKTGSDSNIIPFIMFDRDFDYLIPALQVITNNTGTGGAWVSETIATFIPTSYMARYRGTLWGGNNTQNYAVAPINPGVPTSGSNLSAAKGYAWILTGSNGGQTNMSLPFDFPYVSNNIWYNGTSNTGSVYFTGFKLNF